MAVSNWMSWCCGVDLVAATSADLEQPNVIVHLAGMVHTPVGSAPSGMVCYQPDPAAPPQWIGYVCSDEKVGAYYGPKIFAGTPFENVPVIKAEIKITKNLPDSVSAKVSFGDVVVEVELSELGEAELVNREAGNPLPFAQQGVEAAAGKASLKINGEKIDIVVPPVGIGGGPAAVWAPCGMYIR